jgi:hypothetical protein
VLSEDGLPLAAYPATDGAAAADVWSRLATLGPATRGFLTFRSEVWAFMQGERYGALILADRSVRPGQLLELVERVLAEAATAAALGGGPGRADPRDRGAPARRFSAPLHREPRQADRTDAAAAEVVVSLDGASLQWAGTERTPADAGQEAAVEAAPAQGERADRPADQSDQASAHGADTVTTGRALADAEGDGPAAADPAAGNAEADPASGDSAPSPEGRAGGEVDIMALAREFAGLIFERD